MLKAGDIFQTVTGDVWYVEHVNSSRAHCFHLSAHPTPITTRKGITKVVNRHLRSAAFSPNSIVDLVDPTKLDQLQLRRRLRMARKEEAVAATEQIPGAVQEKAPAAPRVPTKYNRTDKAPAKEIRGQAKEVFDALNAAGSEALSAEDIAARCVFAGSRQDKVRVAAFYVAKFKKEGLIAPVAAAATSDAPAQEPVNA